MKNIVKYNEYNGCKCEGCEIFIAPASSYCDACFAIEIYNSASDRDYIKKPGDLNNFGDLNRLPA